MANTNQTQQRLRKIIINCAELEQLNYNLKNENESLKARIEYKRPLKYVQSVNQ